MTTTFKPPSSREGIERPPARRNLQFHQMNHPASTFGYQQFLHRQFYKEDEAPAGLPQYLPLHEEEEDESVFMGR